jgi:hypothetical protein
MIRAAACSVRLAAVVALPSTLSAQGSIPANAHRFETGWDCDRGFRQVGNACERVAVPANARIDTAGHRWECHRGYRQVANACEFIVIPVNAQLVKVRATKPPS